MSLKRTVTLEPADMPVQKRLKRVEAQVKKNRPEMKMFTSAFNALVPPSGGGANLLVGNITGIAQGDSVDQRSGNKVKIWRVEIRGTVSNEIDTYLLQSHVPAAPTNANFDTEGIPASFVTALSANVNFTEWAYRQSRDTTDNQLRIIRKFKGMELSFPGTATTASRNNLYVVFRNPTTTADNSASGWCRVWFTDA